MIEINELHKAWDTILDNFLELVKDSILTVKDSKKIKQEINLLYKAARGQKHAWTSVLEIGLILIEKDVTVNELKLLVNYDQSTISRALNRLKSAGFATIKESSKKIWTIDKEKCSILYRIVREDDLKITK